MSLHQQILNGGSSGITYSTGNPCKYGHPNLRYTKGKHCVECVKNKKRNKERDKNNTKKYRNLHPYSEAICSAKKRAIKQCVPFDISIEWARNIWTGKCAITGIEFDLQKTGRTGAKDLSPSIDRIKPSIGYTKDNCRFILMCINAFKGRMTDIEMRFIAEKILSGETA
jgi:hypothetical protein